MMTNRPEVQVIGAGLAGAEAAWQLLKHEIPVHMIEMRPEYMTPAHKGAGFSELVCSNSLKAEHVTNASGLLKAEMDKLGSLILDCAHRARVPAGAALAVDRERLSYEVETKLRSHPLFSFECARVDEMPDSGYAIVATGPLTDNALAQSIIAKTGGESLHFFDAAAPIVTAESIDMQKAFRQSRHGHGDDYINCPMNEQQYNAFCDALESAALAPLHDFELKKVFEGCLAVEILCGRGRQTLSFGPMKPVGLIDPHTNRMPYAVVQLRQDNEQGTLYNMVGFQTRLKWGEQRRVFSMIPGLEHAEFARYGVMHQNIFLNSPTLLGRNYAYNKNQGIRFAGQLTGVEGYMESTASGLVAGLNLARMILGEPEYDFGDYTLIGALERYVRTKNPDFQPMNANFGLLEPLAQRIRNKQQRYEKLAERSLNHLDTIINHTEDTNGQ